MKIFCMMTIVVDDEYDDDGDKMLVDDDVKIIFNQNSGSPF